MFNSSCFNHFQRKDTRHLVQSERLIKTEKSVGRKEGKIRLNEYAVGVESVLISTAPGNRVTRCTALVSPVIRITDSIDVHGLCIISLPWPRTCALTPVETRQQSALPKPYPNYPASHRTSLSFNRAQFRRIDFPSPYRK